MSICIKQPGQRFSLKRPEYREKTGGGAILPRTTEEKPKELGARAQCPNKTDTTKTNVTSTIPARRSRVACASALMLLTVGTAGAQQSGTGEAAADSEEEAVFTLSPFEVAAGEDVGYRATHTLSGSRMNTKLGDLAASI